MYDGRINALANDIVCSLQMLAGINLDFDTVLEVLKMLKMIPKYDSPKTMTFVSTILYFILWSLGSFYYISQTLCY